MNTIYKIKTRNELADFLGITRSKLTYLLYIKGVDNLYTSFDIPKRRGGVRHIHAPQKELKIIQRRIANALSTYQREIRKSNNINNDISHAFQKGKSFITNARIHRNRRFVINIDLENFFDSFHFGRVRGYFHKNYYFEMPIKVATVMAQLTCYQGKLPQGAPSSPIITDLICNIFDTRLTKLARKYRLNYTRYADDLTFSTNDRKFIDNEEEFLVELSEEIRRTGFKINKKKTRIQYRDSRQEVTGVIVNKKLHVDREYYKNTRAMAHQLYKTGEFYLEKDIPGTLNQLEGRFSFINQLEWYNNMQDTQKHTFEYLNGRERAYSEFLFYKYFFANPKPLIVTEGKTDVVYIKAALKKMWMGYPELISKDSHGKVDYKISFLKRSKRLSYFLNIKKDGADTMNNIYKFFTKSGGEKYPNYISYFKEIGNQLPSNPVILLFDNELANKDKPVSKFIKNKLDNTQVEHLKKNQWVHMTDNLYLLLIPCINDEDEWDIETLFDKATLSQELDGKKFCKKDGFDTEKYYGKEIFSKHIAKNYTKIDFSGFRPLLDLIRDILKDYQNR